MLDPERAAEVERLALRYLAGRETLFAGRIAAGLIRDGHGDLLADDVFVLPDGPRALDCLEFDDRLRYVDGLDDAAFLAMDLERLGAAELGRAFLDWYVEFAGAQRVPSLEHHYIAYRAFVRAKDSGRAPSATSSRTSPTSRSSDGPTRTAGAGAARGVGRRGRDRRGRARDSVASPGWCSARSASRCCGTRPAPS